MTLPLARLASGITLPLAAGAAMLAVLAGFASPYALRLLTIAGSYALLVIGYQFIFGHAGALSLAQGAFFGIGAYVTGILATRLGWSFLATFPLGILLPLIVAALAAAPVLRLQSHYFALATLGIAQVALLLAINWQDLTGGANGIAGVPGIVVLGASVPRGAPLLAFVWALVALGGIAAWRMTRDLVASRFALLREHPLAAASSGIDGARMRFLAFLASAGYAGAAGALHAHTLRVVSPEATGFGVMVACLAMTVVGGRARIAGAVLGALLLVWLPESVAALERWRGLAYGAALLAAIIAAPRGLVGAAERLRARLFPEPKAAAPPAIVPEPAPAARDPVLAVAGIAKRFGGVEALAGVSLVLRPGEALGLIGPNGSGKTTLLNIIAGLGREDAGEVILESERINLLPTDARARRGIGRTFQSVALVDDMTALDAVALAVPTRDPARARGEAMHWLGSLDLADIATRPCGALSPGLRRRVEIARALALRPKLLLLDEPAAGLSRAEQHDLAQRLERLKRAGLALVVVEHNVAFLMGLADRVACLERGRIIATGTPETVRRDARVIAAYLGPAA